MKRLENMLGYLKSQFANNPLLFIFKFLVIILFIVIIFSMGYITRVVVDNYKEPECEVRLTGSEFNYRNFMYNWDANADNMMLACNYFKIKHPHIVSSQAILESGNFTSYVFIEYNNPFGLYDSKNKDYFKFNHWTEAVEAYKTMIEYKYENGDYYEFLKGLPYAQDDKYIHKLKQVQKAYLSDWLNE